MCWVQIVVAIVIAIIGEAIRPKAKGNTGKPAGLGDFQFPTSEAGRVFPLLAGTVKILGPNTTAAGLLRIEESYKYIKTGWWTTTKSSYGFRYYLSFQQVLCGGQIDEVLGVQVNDTFLKSTITKSADWIDVYVNDLGFYGRPEQDGGFGGLIRIYRGTPTQMPDSVLASVLDQTDISAYRYVSYMMFRDFYVSMSSNPPPFAPIVSRFPNSLGVPDNEHIINTTASNPVCFAYDVMVSNIREMGIAAAKIDRAAFLYAAHVVFTEGIGVNLLIDSSSGGGDVLKSLEQYFDGQIFEDPFTALYTIKLARADYVVDDLLVLDDDNSHCVGRTKTDWADTKNTINVTYVDKEKNWTNQSVQVQDLANLTALGQQINGTDLDFSGCDNADLANYLAERARTSLATPFTQLQIEAHGAGSTLRKNDVFVASYPDKRIQLMVMRVTDIEYPSADEAVTKIQAVEDKFGVKYVAYTATSDVHWTPPPMLPLPAAAQAVRELPYAMSPGLSQDRYAFTAASRAGAVESGYDVLNVGANLVLNTVDDLTSSGKLLTPLAAGGATAGSTLASGLIIQGVIDPQGVTSSLPSEYLIGTSMLLIGNELFAFQNVVKNVDGTITLWPWQRAVYDSIPQDHFAGDDVFVLSSGIGLAQTTPFPSDVTVNFKLLMKAGQNTLAAADAVTVPLLFRSRGKRPYPPAGVMLNGRAIQSYTVADVVSPDLSLSWTHRDRIAQGVNILSYVAASVGPEAGTTYTVRYYNATTNVLLLTQAGITGTSTTATLTYDGPLRIDVVSVRDTLESYFVTSATITHIPSALLVAADGVTPLLASDGITLLRI